MRTKDPKLDVTPGSLVGGWGAVWCLGIWVWGRTGCDYHRGEQPGPPRDLALDGGLGRPGGCEARRAAWVWGVGVWGAGRGVWNVGVYEPW